MVNKSCYAWQNFCNFFVIEFNTEYETQFCWAIKYDLIEHYCLYWKLFLLLIAFHKVFIISKGTLHFSNKTKEILFSCLAFYYRLDQFKQVPYSSDKDEVASPKPIV